MRAPPNTCRLVWALVGTLSLALAACQNSDGQSGAGGSGAAGSSAAGSGGAGGRGGSAGTSATAGSGATGGSAGSGTAGSGGTAGGSTAGSGGAPGDTAAPADVQPPADAAAMETAAPDATETDSTPPPPGSRQSEACGKPSPVPAEGYHTLKVGTLDRRFFLRLPPGYDHNKPWPVIFGLHGAGNKNGNWFDTNTGLRRETQPHAVLVFGESLYRPGSTTERSWQDEGQLPANLAYIDATVTWVRQNLCVDPARVFAAGQSSGAYFAQTLACHRGDVFRAVASSDGGERLFDACRGHASAFIRYRPAGLSAGDSRRARDFWIQHNGCRAGSTQSTNTPPCVAYAGCQGDTRLWECTDDGAHDWPAYMDRGVWTFFSLFN